MGLSKVTLLAAVAAAATLGASAAHGAILAQYDFNNSTLASSDADATSTATNMSIGSGISTAAVETANPYGTFVGVPANVTPASEDLALANNAYVSFTVSAPTLALSSITYDLSTSWGGSTPAAFGWALYSSVGGFASSADHIAAYSQATGVPGLAWLHENVDLSAAAFQNLSSVEFRLYVWDGASSSTSHDRLDNVVLNGTASAVPEPASLGLLALGAMAFLRRRR